MHYIYILMYLLIKDIEKERIEIRKGKLYYD